MDIYEGDTLQIPYLLLGEDGGVVPLPASATVTVQLEDNLGTVTTFTLADDPEVTEAAVEVGGKSGDGVLFEAVPEEVSLRAAQYTYYIQIRGSVSDDEVGEFKIKESPTP